MTSAEPRLRNRHLRRVSAQLGDLCSAVEALSLNMHRWQRQIDDVDIYVLNRQRWISHGEGQIKRLQRQISTLEAEYYALDGEE